MTSDHAVKFELLCNLLGLKPEDFKIKNRRNLPKAAAIIAAVMYARGATTPEIAELMYRNRTTIVNYLNKVKRTDEWTKELPNRLLRDYELCYTNRITPNSSYDYHTVYSEVIKYE